ncbi:MAG: hypothetical protein K1060chlam4_01322, partial [Candidatus Anoxychlamydiales bacterium]|nr:hypothetical protein [Candidatus Anoxychlamydiales bacterium]
QTFLNFVREETSLRDTFINRLFEAKTPLGEVLQELQNSQESPNRKLLSKETFRKAGKEAIELTKKEMALAIKKGERKDSSNEISYLQKRQTFVEKIGSEFQVNTYATGIQREASAANLNNDTFIVTWESNLQDGSSFGIYGQAFNVDGSKSGSEFLVNTYTINVQDQPSVTSLSNDKFVVTWRSVGQDGDFDGIYGQIFNANRTKSGSEFQVNTNISYKSVPSIADLNNGKFAVTWTSSNQDGSGYGIYGQIFNGDGTKSGSEFLVNTYTTNWQVISSIAVLNNGNFVITWQSNGQDGDGYGIFGQVFNADGTKNGSEFQVNTYTLIDQKYSSVASLSNNKFVISWFSDGQDGSSNGIFGQMFNADGTKNGLEFPVNTYTINSQEHPSVTNLNNNGFVITWGSYGQDGSSYGIYGQLFNEDGTKNGLEFPVNTYTTNSQQTPSAVSLNNDKFVITWQSNGQDGSSSGIYGQVFRLPSITTSSTTSSRTSSSSTSSLTSSSSTRSSRSSSSKNSSSRLSTRSDSASRVSTVDVFTKETKATINSATVSNSSASVTNVATKNMFTTKNSSNSTKRT